MAAPTSDLTTIRTKVRRLARIPSEAQLSNDELDQYINTFVVYDFPEHLRTFNLRQTFSFFTNPYPDVYYLDIAGYGNASNASANALYDFQNKYLTIHPPVYIAGYQQFYTQSPEQFWSIYPQVKTILSIGVQGDGVTSSFSGILNQQQSSSGNNLPPSAVIVKESLLFSSVDTNGNGLSMVDNPILDATTGNPTIYGKLYPTNGLPATPLLLTAPYQSDANFPSTNYINYQTGQYVVSFTAAPASGAPIDSQYLAQVPTLPQAMMMFENQITIRPVPDQPYQINFEVYKAPTALLSAGAEPALKEYWQYIAYGAAIKIVQDKSDTETAQQLMPEYKNQEALCLRRTLVQYSNERASTIYTEQTGVNASGYWGWSGSSF